MAAESSLQPYRDPQQNPGHGFYPVPPLKERTAEILNEVNARDLILYDTLNRRLALGPGVRINKEMRNVLSAARKLLFERTGKVFTTKNGVGLIRLTEAQKALEALKMRDRGTNGLLSGLKIVLSADESKLNDEEKEFRNVVISILSAQHCLGGKKYLDRASIVVRQSGGAPVLSDKLLTMMTGGDPTLIDALKSPNAGDVGKV